MDPASEFARMNVKITNFYSPKPISNKVSDTGKSSIRTIYKVAVTGQRSLQSMENRVPPVRAHNAKKITVVKNNGRELPWDRVRLIGTESEKVTQRRYVQMFYNHEQAEMQKQGFITDAGYFNEDAVLKRVDWGCYQNLGKELAKRFSFPDVVKYSVILPVIGKKIAESEEQTEWLDVKSTLLSGKSIWVLRDKLRSMLAHEIHVVLEDKHRDVLPDAFRSELGITFKSLLNAELSILLEGKRGGGSEGVVADAFDKKFTQLTLDYFKDKNGEFNVPRIYEYVKKQSYQDVKDLISDDPVIRFDHEGIIYDVLAPLYGELKAASLKDTLESKLRKGEQIIDDVNEFRPRFLEQAQKAYERTIKQKVAQINNELSYEKTVVDQQTTSGYIPDKKMASIYGDQKRPDIEEALSRGKSIKELIDEFMPEFEQLILDYFKNENGEFNIARIREYIKKQSYKEVRLLIDENPAIGFDLGVLSHVIAPLYGELKAISLANSLESKLRKGEQTDAYSAQFRPGGMKAAQQAYDIKIEEILADIEHKISYETFVDKQKRAVLTADCTTPNQCMVRQHAEQLFNRLETLAAVDSRRHSQTSVPVVHHCFRNPDRYCSDFPVYTALTIQVEGDGNCIQLQLPINKVQLHEFEPEMLAAQSPLPGGQDYFWQLMCGEKIPVIVDLTRKSELQESKVDAYYPEWIRSEEKKRFQNVEVTLCTDTRGSDSDDNDIRVCKYQVRTFPAENVPESTHTITRVHYHVWDDQQGVDPEKLNKLIDLVDEIAGKDSIAVHCSDGVGRTGIFITARTARHMLERGQLSDHRLLPGLEKLILTGRKQRSRYFVQTRSQVQALVAFCHRLAIPTGDKQWFR